MSSTRDKINAAAAKYAEDRRAAAAAKAEAAGKQNAGDSRQKDAAAEKQNKAQQAQFQQEAQQPQQEQAPETTFTDEANKGQSQNTEQQEQNKYSREANEGTQKAGYTPEGNYYDPEADKGFVDLFAKDEGKRDDPAKTLAETAEGKQKGGAETDFQKTVEANKAARQAADEANAEATRLQNEKDANSNMWADGVFIGMDEETAKSYDERIKAAKGRAEEALKGATNLTNAERDAALKTYQDAVETERTVTSGETAVSQADADAARQNRKAAEEALKDINRSLGNEVYYGLADEAQARDLFEGWAGERAAGTASAVGTALEWFDTASDDMTRYEYDQEHGEGAYDRAVEGKNLNAIGDAGRELFDAAQGWNEQAQKDWASGTEDMSETGKQIAGLGKSAADMTADMIENMILPGAGRLAMAGRVAGQGALTQAGRENNDIDTRMAKAAFDGATAFLSEYMMGGAESVYGKSIIGKAMGNAMAGMPKGVQTAAKVFFNTEGAEEGLEYGLTYLGDRILGFDPEAQFDWNEMKQNIAVGYLMGVLFNGVTAGINYDGKKIRAAADEGIDAANSGMTPEEITRAAVTQPDDNVKIEAGAERAETKAEAEAETSAPEATAPEGETPAAEPQPEAPQLGAMDTGAQTEAHQWIRNTLSGGAVSEQDISRILSNAANRQAFTDVTGISLAGKSFEEARNIVGQASASVPTQNTSGPERYQRSDNETVATIQERGTISQREASRLLRDPDARAAFEEAYGISLEGKGESRATQEIIDAVNRQKTRERATGQYFEIPAAEPGNTEGPGEAGSRERSEYERDVRRWQQAQDDVVRILSGEDLSRKDATRLMNDDGLWQAFEDATGVDLHGRPRTEQNVREAVREAKANMPSEPEVLAEAADSTENTQPPANMPQGAGAVVPEAGAAEGQNPNAESTAPENGAETLANAAEGQSRVNTPGNAENAVEGGLNSPETNEGGNPLVTAAEGRENTGNQAGNPAPETRKVPTNPEGVAGPNIPNNPTPPRRSRERISQFFTNTLTESGRATGMNQDDFTYKVKSEAESLTNAIMALDERGLETFENLMNAPAWDGEMVDSAWMIENEFYKEFVKTGDRSRLDNWKQIEAAKIRETARGLQAVAKQSRPGAAGVLNAIMNEVNSARQANAEAEKAGRTKDIIPEETLARAEEKANEVARRMAELEIEVDESVKAGTSEADAQNAVKERYLDLIDEINTFRHTGLFQDMGKHAGARADAKAQKQVRDLNTKFRQKLSNEGMDYIMRFAACDAAGISEDIHYKGKQDFMKRLNTWQKLAQLTGTGTWLRNGVGNGSFGIVDVLSADNPVTWLTDALISLKTGKRSSGFETGIVNRSARDAAAHALNRSILEVAANIDLSSDSDTTKYDMGRTRTYDPDSENALTRVFSRWEQWNGYMLQSSDAWFKGMAEGSVESSVRRANRWGEDNLTDTERSSMDPEKADALSKRRQAELDEVKKQVAAYRTFQNDGWTATRANEIRDWLNKAGAGVIGKQWQQGQFGLGTALMPYTKVPTNLAVKSLEFSPAGAAKGVAEIVKVLTDPNATMAQQNKAVTDFGRGLTGTAIIWGFAQLMKNAKWFKDWNDEDDKDVKAQNKSEGKSGIQINYSMLRRQFSGDKSGEWRTGDRVIDISSMEPLNQLITTGGLIAQLEEPDLKGVAQAFWTSAKDSVEGMPALQTLASIEDSIRYTDTPEEGWMTFFNTAATTLGNVAGGMVPGPVRHIAQVTDEKQRDTSGNNPFERTVNTVKSSIPGLRETLPVKTDAYGNEQSAGNFATRFANQYDSFKHNQVNQSEVSREVERIREETGESHVPSRTGPRSVTFGSGSGKEQVKLTAEERKDYRDANGQDFSKSMEELMKDPVYLLADDDTKELLMAEAESYANDGAKLNLAGKHDIDFESKYADYREMEDPVEVLAAQTAYSTAKKDEDWDAVDALLKTIQRGDGRISEEGMDFMIGKDSKINYYTYLADQGVPTKRAKAFEEDLKELYTSEKRNDSRSTDMIRVAGNGKYTEKEADAIMGYEREVSDESRQRYQDQLAWNLEKAGKSGMYNEVWSRIEAVETGDMESATFKKWVDKNIPLEQRKAVKDIASNLAEDRHAAGKYVSSFYGAAREIGCTPEQALQFFEHIDTNYNGSYTKKEIRAAVKWAFGSGQNAKDVTAYLKERGIL